MQNLITERNTDMSNGATPISIVGNLTDDPELRFTPTGVAVANFTVAVNHKRYDNATKRWEDAGTDFHRVTTWRSTAENVADSLRKGDRVIVIGDMRSNTYEDKEGNKRTAWEITGTSVGPDLMFSATDIRKTEYHKPSKSESDNRDDRNRSTRARR